MEGNWRQKERKGKPEVTNEDQVYFSICSSDIYPLTFLFHVYIYTHMYAYLYMYVHICICTYTRFLYFSSSGIKIVIFILFMWEEHETDKITKSHFVAGGLSPENI